jgi:hypothetical protein
VIELRLTYEGNGAFRVATKLDFDLASQEFDQGDRVRAQITKPRSIRQNAYFHALVQAAFDNQRGGPQVETWEHLKSWLLIHAGWCEEYRFKRGSLSKEVAEVLRRKFDFVDFTVVERTGEIIMRFAKSISFKACPPEKMSEIMDKAVAIICTEIVPGMDPETIFNMARGKAA